MASEVASRSQVALVRCEGYDEVAVHEAVGRGLTLLGGVERFAQSGENILVKPNLLTASAPENAVTTHPAVFKAVARHLGAAGVNLSYGDSPGFGSPAGAARKSGLVAVAEELDIPLAKFTTGQQVSFHDGNLIKQFTIAGGVLAADGLVSLPKLKTHAMVRVTGAVKNQFGCIPGLFKGEFHAKVPDMDLFSQVLVDLNRYLRPRLFVMDGIVAMEGNGPRGGDPKQMSVLLFSDDPVALDATVCRMVNLDPELVPTNVWGEAWGLGTANQIELLGDPLESFVASDFVVNRRPGSTTGWPGWMGDLLKNLLVPRPAVIPENCTRCGTCVKVCPVDPKAIEFQNGREQLPRHDYSRCIRCYCCQEMCPEHAITVKTPLLGKLLIHR